MVATSVIATELIFFFNMQILLRLLPSSPAPSMSTRFFFFPF